MKIIFLIQLIAIIAMAQKPPKPDCKTMIGPRGHIMKAKCDAAIKPNSGHYHCTVTP